MDPKELAAQFAKKNGESSAQKAKEKATAEENAAKLRKDEDDAKMAFANVIIPYLSDMKAAFPAGKFAFSTSSVGVRITIGNGPTVAISWDSGRILVIETDSRTIWKYPICLSGHRRTFYCDHKRSYTRKNRQIDFNDDRQI